MHLICRAFSPDTWPAWALVLVGATGTFYAALTLKAIRHEAQIANRAVISAFRPRLIIRRVSLIEGLVIPVAGQPDGPWRIQYAIANIGGSRAHIVESSAGVDIFEKGILPPIPPYADPPKILGDFILEPGEHRDFSIDLNSKTVNSLRLFLQSLCGPDYPQNAGFIYFLGYIQFRDDLKTARRIGFCRHYEVKTMRFSVVSDDDYEYAD